MSGTLILLELAGYIALLLWGIHMIQSGILRAFGAELRHGLAQGLESRLKAFLAGFGITTLMQSSTATALMASSFVASGLMAFAPAMAAILGANVGSTVIVQLLSFNVAAVAPVFILGGVIAFKRGQRTRARDLGRVAIGIGLVLLALRAILFVIAPVEKTEALRQLLALLAGDPAMNILIGAVLTWAAYSSVATVLVVMALGAAHVIAPPAILALVLGANIGIVIPQYLSAGSDPVARRLALGNMIVRGTGALAVLPFITAAAEAMTSLGADPARLAANFHTLFNLGLAVIFMGLLDPLGRLCSALLPEAPGAAEPGAPRYLASDEPETPGIAIANAQREVLRIVDLVKRMLESWAAALGDDDRKKLAEIAALDDAIDRLHGAVKSHLIGISRDSDLAEPDARRCTEILTFAINLEHTGDILDMSLRELAARKIRNRLTFAPEGSAQIEEMRQRVLAQIALAVSVFMTRDERDARLLLDEKVRMRDIADQAQSDHLQRLREGRPETIETSALYLDMIRDLKRITAHLASVAYPVLEERGALLRSRVVDLDEERAGRQTRAQRPS